MRNSVAMFGACAALAATPALAQEAGAHFKIRPVGPTATALALAPLASAPSVNFGGEELRFDLAAQRAPVTPGVEAPTFGGTLRVGARERDETVRDGLGRLGVSARDGSSFRGQSRLYLFAAASGTAVGMNVTRGEAGWRGSGVSTDRAAKLQMSGQAGVGWRKDDLQASLGYVRRKFKITDPRQQAYPDLYDSSDDAVALSVSFRPSR